MIEAEMAIERTGAKDSPIIPDQRCDRMSEEERRRNSVLWQPKAQALDEEIRQSRKVQQTLQVREAELRDFLENAVIGMHWLAPDGTILWANRTELDLLGYEPEQFTGRPIAEFIPDAAAGAELLRRLRNCESIRSFEVSMRRGDGTQRWIRLDANPWIHNGEYLHARCFVTDVTEQRRAHETQSLLAAIVRSSDDAIASKDLNGIVTSWNAAAERILGWTAKEMIGQSILKLIPPELQGDEPEILRKIQAGEHIDHFETIRVTKSGERINVSLSISPVRDGQGKIVGAAKVLRDVTAQKKLESALRTTERLALVGRLAASVAHEINNPLEAVTNLIYLARLDSSLPDNVRQCLGVADEELHRVSHIARQTLGFYRDTSFPVMVDVNAAVDEVLAIYDRRLRYKQLRARKQIAAGLTVSALMGELKQVLSNLISNAIDASVAKTEIRISVWAACHRTTNAPGIRLAVADQGTGVPIASRRHLFAPFFTTKKDFGTGLGLWITRDLLEKRGGSVRCRSRVEGESEGRAPGTIMMAFVPTVTDPAGYAAAD